MRSISKSEHCLECAKKCKSQAESMHFAIMLAPTKADYDLCTRKFNRAIKHGKKYVELLNYYGGNL
jgi:hypothetical protein